MSGARTAGPPSCAGCALPRALSDRRRTPGPSHCPRTGTRESGAAGSAAFSLSETTAKTNTYTRHVLIIDYYCLWHNSLLNEILKEVELIDLGPNTKATEYGSGCETYEAE